MVRVCPQGLQMLIPALFRRREKALEGEAPCGQAGNAEGRNHGAGTGDGGDGDVSFSALPDQVLTWVRNGRGTGVRHQGADLPGLNSIQDFPAAGSFVVLIIAHQGLF